MKLTYFSEQTLPKQMGGKGSISRVTFNKAGVINFNKSSCALMALKAGDKVTLAQDEEEPAQWYFFKDKENGFGLRAGYKGNACMFNHRDLVKAFLGSFDKDHAVTHNFKIAGKPTVMKGSKTEYWGILV